MLSKSVFLQSFQLSNFLEQIIRYQVSISLHRRIEAKIQTDYEPSVMVKLRSLQSKIQGWS